MQQSEGQGMSLKVRLEAKVEAVQWKHPSSKPVILSLLKGRRFNGKSYYLPTLSVSILPDCKHVIFNTPKISTQTSSMAMEKKRFDLPEVELSDWFKDEHQHLYSKTGANIVQWNSGTYPPRTYPPNNTALIWYRTEFNAPKGNNAVALDLTTMSKGQAWVNGHHIGRYFPSFNAPTDGCSDTCDYRGTYYPTNCVTGCGKSSQEWKLLATHLEVIEQQQQKKSPELDAVSCSSLISGSCGFQGAIFLACAFILHTTNKVLGL
ncbi:hypothetical protein SUGI_1012250 [Cryptomeria japonica]|nr:hypothetical protein SUGI_1012250 [Cryptomeria japonica]